MKYKVVLLLMSLFIFIPGANAQENYFDYEIIELESLPTASAETIDKIYKVNDKYYLGESLLSDYIPIPLNEDLKGKIIYIDYKSITYELIDNFYSSGSIKDGQDFVTFNKNFDDKLGRVHFSFFKNNRSNIKDNHYSLIVPHLNYASDNQMIAYLEDGTYQYVIENFVSNFSFSITDWILPEMEKYFSLTPFEVTYSFKEIDKSLVIPPVKDFYLFYTFEDIQEFKVLELFDLSTFTDFEKLVVTLLFNILFLGFLGFCCYILLKFIYKGISMLFR